jgi:ribonuclease HI
VDSTSALRQVKRLIKGDRARQSYPNDADIMSHIKWLLTQISAFKVNVEWVKAHQDDECAFEDLPWNAQLNVLADSLATKIPRDKHNFQYSLKK